jgi:uncharacterized protein YjiS (DUF1127 family)
MINKLWSRPKRWLLSIDAYFTVHQDLGRLSDRQLADIGISRSDIEFYATRAYIKAKEG